MLRCRERSITRPHPPTPEDRGTKIKGKGIQRGGKDISGRK